jgi:amino-acid N-acetyltransferase
MSVGVRAAGVGDYGAVRDLLRAADLPLDGLSDTLDHFIVVEDGTGLVAAAGLEVYGRAALLRSVVVAPSRRGAGLGGLLHDGTIAMARELGVRDVYLLTETAEKFFRRCGYAVVLRDDVPTAVRGSVEFTTVCPASAVVMHHATGLA